MGQSIGKATQQGSSLSLHSLPRLLSGVCVSGIGDTSGFGLGLGVGLGFGVARIGGGCGLDV